MKPADAWFLLEHATAWADRHQSADYDPTEYAAWVFDNYRDEDSLSAVPSHPSLEVAFLQQKEVSR